MRIGSLGALALALSSPSWAATDQQLAVADRFADALAAGGELSASYFREEPSKADLELFELYGECRADDVKSLRVNRESSPAENRVMVRFRCPGTPKRYPIYISLYFDGEKIAAIETHNADLLRSENG